VALLLYLVTLDNGLQPDELIGGDLITHQYAQVQARPSNAPGYPLYTLGGWLWFHGIRTTLHTFGSAAPNPLPILSSYSTLWALLALASALRHPQPHHAVAAPACRSLAARLAAERLLRRHLFLLVLRHHHRAIHQRHRADAGDCVRVFAVARRGEGGARGGAWGTGRQGEGETRRGEDKERGRRANLQSPLSQSRPSQLLILLAFLCGLALAHMLTVAFIVPPLVIAILWEQPHLLRNWRLLLACIGAALLPLVSYAYVYLRGAAHPEWWGAGEWANANDWFWSFVSTSQGRDELARGFQATCAFFDGGFPALIWGELSIPFLVIGLLGIALLGRKPAFVLYGTLAIYLVFNWMYRCGNWYQVILPAYPLILLGVAAVLDRWESRLIGRSRWLAYAPLALLVVMIIWRFDASWPRVDSRNRAEDTGLARAAILLDQPLPEGAGLFAPVEDALALDYLINIWGLRPDLRVVSSKQAGELLQQGAAVLTTLDAAPVLLEELPAGLTPRARSSARTGCC
jgi:hypothetical protein